MECDINNLFTLPLGAQTSRETEGGARRVAKRTATCEMTALQIECGLTGAAPAAAIHQTADEPLRLFKASA